MVSSFHLESQPVPQFLLCAWGLTAVFETGVRALSLNTQMMGRVQGCGRLGTLAVVGGWGRSWCLAPPTPACFPVAIYQPPSLTLNPVACPHVVRARQHAGHHAQLRHPGHVPAL